jgi:hypothetical protein
MINGRRVIICGGRDFKGRPDHIRWLNELDNVSLFHTIISGGARGADKFGEFWGWCREKRVVVVPADWDVHGKAAGPYRNQAMIDNHHPDLVVAFPGGRGTADMINRAEMAGIECVLWDDDVPF